MSTRIAVIGVGLMGSSLARHLLSASFPVTVHDSDPAKVDALVKLGAKKAAAPDRIPPEVDVVMLSLPNSHIVDDVNKDSRLILGLGAKVDCPLPLMSLYVQALASEVSKGRVERDPATIIDFYSELAGLGNR